MHNSNRYALVDASCAYEQVEALKIARAFPFSAWADAAALCETHLMVLGAWCLVLVLMIAWPSAMSFNFSNRSLLACIRLHRWIADFILSSCTCTCFFFVFFAQNASWFGFVQTVQSADTFFGGLPEGGAR